MKRPILTLMVAIAVNVACRAEAVPREVPTPAPRPATIPAPTAARAQQSAADPSAIFSNTNHVEALAAHSNTLWVATRGGLEEYDMKRRVRSNLYSTRDGLPSLLIKNVTVTSDGLPVVTTAHHECQMQVPSRRFACTSRPTEKLAPHLPSRDRIEGIAVTANWDSPDGSAWVGTAGLGLWQRSRGNLQRLTPTDQIASNHVVAISEWNHSSWFATFDAGLSRLRDGHFSTVPLGPRMLNDVLGTEAGLFIATSDGLYVSRDGETFQREARVTERFINDLAYDARRHRLFATATNSLWELALDNPRALPRVSYQPGGSRALQAVDVSSDGTIFLASEDRGVLRRQGKKRFVGFDRLSGYPSSWAIDVLALGGHSAIVGSLRHGVFSLDGTNPITQRIDPWILFLGRDPSDPKSIFVGTQAGAILVDAMGARSLAGLPNPCVHSIARLTSGLWVGTEGGLAQYRPPAPSEGQALDGHGRYLM